MPAALATLLAGWQRVVYERPPPNTLQRGLVALPRGPTVVVVIVAVVALLAYSLRKRATHPSKPRATKR